MIAIGGVIGAGLFVGSGVVIDESRSQLVLSLVSLVVVIGVHRLAVRRRQPVASRG